MEPMQELVCAGCGAPMEMGDHSSNVVRCKYCGHEHAFLRPPAPPKDHAHTVGDPVAVHWGGRWWAGQVVAHEGGEAWKVRYDGWSDAWDEVVGPERIRSHIPGTATTTTVTTTSSSTVTTAHSKPRSTLRSLAMLAFLISSCVILGGVFFECQGQRPGPVASTGPAVNSTTALHAGEAVEIEWNGSWYDGSVLSVSDDGTVRVHYSGWADSYDEDVPRTRLRVPGSGAR